MHDAGSVPDTKFVLCGRGKVFLFVPRQQETGHCMHRLISTLSTLFDIMNNLQVCADCHTVIKIIANIMGEQLLEWIPVASIVLRVLFCSCNWTKNLVFQWLNQDYSCVSCLLTLIQGNVQNALAVKPFIIYGVHRKQPKGPAKTLHFDLIFSTMMHVDDFISEQSTNGDSYW